MVKFGNRDSEISYLETRVLVGVICVQLKVQLDVFFILLYS
jgi:hypothetical protein